MSKIFNKASKMLMDNRHRRNWRLGAGVMAMVLAAVVSALLVGRASALTGGNTLHDALTGDSALLWEAADAPTDGDQSAWQKVDPNTPVDSTARLRLRLAFKLGAQDISDDYTLQYRLPDGLQLADTAADGSDAVAIYDASTVAVPSHQNATHIGTASIEGGVITFHFSKEEVMAADEALRGVSYDSASDEPQSIDGFVDLDFAFGNLALDADGLATLRLNDAITLEVSKAAVATDNSADDAGASETAPAATQNTATDASAVSQDVTENDGATSPSSATDASTTDTNSASASADATGATSAVSGDSASGSSDAAASEAEPAAEASENEATTAENESSTESEGEAGGEVQSVSTAQLSALSISSAKASLGTMLRDASAGTTIEGTSHLTQVTILKKVGAGYEVPDSYSDGDQIEAHLKFHFDRGDITLGHQTVTYQLPKGIHPTEAVTGAAIYDNNGKQVGTVDVDTNGLVTMKFYDSYATGNAIDAEVYFTGTVSSSGADEDGKIHFQDGSYIKIVKPSEPDKHDVSIKKEGSINQTGADYKLTVSTKNGTGGVVTVMDTLNWSNNIDYSNNQSSTKDKFYDHEYGKPVVTKVSAKGETSTVDPSSYTLEWTTSDGTEYGTPRFVIRNLPELAVGEKYEITYKALFRKTDANADAQINNAATASRPHGRSDTNQTINWNSDDQKKGTYDAGSKTIHWTITANRNQKDANGLTIRDTLPNDLVGDVVVKDSHGNTVMTLNDTNNHYDNATKSGYWSNRTLWIRLPSNLAYPTDQYTVEYQTKVTGTTGTETVSNSATTQYKDGSSNTATGTVKVNHQENWGINKSVQAQTGNGNKTGYLGDGVYRQAWSTTVTMPEAGVDSFTITDTIADATAADGTPLGSDSHYAIASELYQELYQYGVSIAMRDKSAGTLYTDYADNDPIKMIDGSKMIDGHYAATDAATVTVRMYDAIVNGNLVDLHSMAHVKRFEVTITPKRGTNISGTSTTLRYSTRIDTRSAQDGTTVKATNTASINGQKSSADTRYMKTNTFQKQVLSGKTNDGKDIWSDGTKSVDYNKTDSSKNKATFRILIDTTNASGDITVTDTLPKGMNLVPNSASLMEYHENWESDESSRLTTSMSTTAEGRTIITFKIKEGYDKPAQLYIRYDASFAYDESWNDEAKTDQSYVNTAQWNSSTSTSTISVHREPERMMKIGAQETDANGSPTNKVKYHIVINPKAEDLNQTSDYLDLTDVLTADPVFQPQLDIQGVVLNGYSDTAADHVDTSVVYPTKAYAVSYDSKTHTLKAKIPDQAACVLTYEYELKGNYVPGASISNSASIDGKWTKSEFTSLAKASAGGSATKGEFYLYKVDSENYQDKLSGAQFDLYSGEGGSFTKKLSDVNVDQKKEWDLLDSSTGQAIFNHDTLYKFVETRAPYGYKVSDMPTYVVWLSVGETEETAWSRIQSSGGIPNDAKKADGTTQITMDDIQFIPNAGGSLYITNEYTRLTVNKQWLASDGSPLETGRIPSSSVQVKLVQDVVKPGSGCTVTVTCTEYNNVTHKTSVLVKSGSAVKVVVPTRKQPGAQMEISQDDGKTWTAMHYDELAEQWYYTIDSVTSNMEVTYRSKLSDYLWMCQQDPVLSDYTKPDDVVTSKDYATVPLNAQNGWTHTWNNLPKQDDSGNAYTYHVEEVSPDSGYRVSYLNNGGITRGTITVTNTMLITLPATGGSGTNGFVLGGAVVAAVAAMALLVRRMRRSE